ncbi:hypothetical protein QQ056_00570 [Oscillatoria laete-virens NRMC-F 0139]|nr:hypothetical protein [Oscillatoria laete-virens]MDL5052069.1 hypothetical protein [Oscillatoria laete-virens NRMC-F 0139]
MSDSSFPVIYQLKVVLLGISPTIVATTPNRCRQQDDASFATLEQGLRAELAFCTNAYEYRGEV